MPAFATYRTRVDQWSYESAKLVLPEIWAGFDSVIDVGCGVGAWLDVAGDLGATRLFGIDGPSGHSPGVFISADLAANVPVVTPRFDLAICLEVAEHLPASIADDLVVALTAMSDVVLFSAAIPGQGGDGHINEQPHEYWDDRFVNAGYALHPLPGMSPMVAWWYRQNARVYRKAVE